ncbi:MAG: hypothetical protein H0X45_09920 [Planctomycetes bacterium]|nr:hypothetical protein [Planctomycetota bacterium]
MTSRSAAVLIVVSGMAALIAALTLAFLVRMRSDAEEAAAFDRQAQARLMVTAALAYVQETARLGWDDEAFGWIDVRDGAPGPRNVRGEMLYAGDPVTGRGLAFPAVGGRAARCPTWLWRRPPSAVEQTVNYNPLPSAPGLDWRANIAYPAPEPRALTDPTWTAAERVDRWRRGDPQPVGGEGVAWFRCYRMTPEDCAAHRASDGTAAPLHWSPAVFALSCGGGGTLGYADWAEVVADGAEASFGGDRALFEDLRAHQAVLWYACEWSPMQGGFGHKYFHADYAVPGGFPDGYGRTSTIPWSQTPTNRPWKDDTSHRPNSRGFGGTFLWIERLARAPDRW